MKKKLESVFAVSIDGKIQDKVYSTIAGVIAFIPDLTHRKLLKEIKTGAYCQSTIVGIVSVYSCEVVRSDNKGNVSNFVCNSAD